jgi:Fur family ferric uptake transcriptional regulator
MSLRQTRQRELVLEIVRGTMDHPSADQVFRQARRRLPRIGLGTVYRNLKDLAAQGLIREIHAGGATARFDANMGRHYHIRCVDCGRLGDLPMSVDDGLEREAGRATSYEILGHQVEVLGRCPNCQNLSKSIESHSRQGRV